MLKKTCILGLVTIAAGIGLVSAPVRAQNAASVDQSSEQNTTQVGSGNSSVNASGQTGIVSQKQSAFGSGTNGANLGQVNEQGTLQEGYGNASVQGNVQTGTIKQGNPYSYYPYSGGRINAADLQQRNGQAGGQLGIGNTAVQAADQNAVLHQH